jgi:transcriptional regulator with XRE-family HTH domain
MVLTSAAKKPTQVRVVRDKAFGRRLEQAANSHPTCPTGHGQQKWLREELERQHGIKVSPEGTRKWFAGESRPKPKVMKSIAQVLQVDEAWLALGLIPTSTPEETKSRNAAANGAENLVASLIQLSGGNIAFANPTKDTGVDIHAIIGGKKYDIQVKATKPTADGDVTFAIEHMADDQTLILVAVDDAHLHSKVFAVDYELVKAHGKERGGYVNLIGRIDGTKLIVGQRAIPTVKDFAKL